MKTLLNLNSTLNICVNCKVRYYINLKVLTIIYDQTGNIIEICNKYIK